MATSYIALIALIVTVCVIGCSTLILLRNSRVCKFRTDVAEAAYDNLIAHTGGIDISLDREDFSREVKFSKYIMNELERILLRHSYDSMLFSCKSLTMEKWYTEGEIAVINGDYGKLRERFGGE